jgi:hypothetical protein
MECCIPIEGKISNIDRNESIIERGKEVFVGLSTAFWHWELSAKVLAQRNLTVVVVRKRPIMAYFGVKQALHLATIETTSSSATTWLNPTLCGTCLALAPHTNAYLKVSFSVL